MAGLAVCALLGGVVTLVGWFAGRPRLTDWVGSGISMFPNTALAAVGSGAGLLLTLGTSRASLRLSRLLGLFVAALGGATLFEHVTGVDLGIDALLMEAKWGGAAVAPGRMGPPASVSFTLLGIALALLSSRRSRTRAVAPVLGVGICAIAALSLMGYAFGADPLFAVARFTGIALQTAVILFVLALAVVVRVPEREPMRTLQENSAAGLLARRSLPFIIAVPVALGWLRIRGEHAGWFDAAMGTSLLALSVVAIFTGLLRWWVKAMAGYERALRESESLRARLAAIVESSGDAILSQSREGVILTWNAAAERLFGYRAEEIVGRSIVTLVPPELRAEEEGVLERLRRGEPHERLQTERLTKHGRRIPVSVTLSPVKDPDGRVIGASKVMHDISDVQSAREALAHEKHVLRTTLASIGDGVVVTDAQGRVSFLNAEAERLTGWKSAEAGGKDLPEVFRIVHEEARNPAENPVEKVLRRGHVVGPANPTVLVAKDGAEIPIDHSAAPIQEPGGPLLGVVLVFRDVTEHKKVQKATKEAKDALARANASLEETVHERTAKLQEMINELQHVSYAITHDMRAPLRAMTSFSQMLLESAENLSPESRDYCQRIQTGAARMDRLIQDALNYSRAVLQDLPLEPVDLSKLAQGLLETYPNFHPERAEVRVEGRLPRVLGNEALLTQCLSNLIGNAVKFVTPGVRPEVRVWSEPHPGGVKIWVQDNGIGIPKHLQDRLFGMFQKLDNRYEGTGIGLAIVRKVVERMGGEVGVESEPGKGSRFWVVLRSAPEEHGGPPIGSSG